MNSAGAMTWTYANNLAYFEAPMLVNYKLFGTAGIIFMTTKK